MMSVFARYVLLPLALLFANASALFAATLTVNGTPGANELIRQLAKAFELHSEINIEVVQGLGETGGIRAVANGAIDIAISGRELNTAELNKSLVSAVRVRTPFVSVKPKRRGATARQSSSVLAPGMTATQSGFSNCFRRMGWIWR